VLRVRGPVAAANVLMCDTLPAHMTFVSAPGATFVGGKACWAFASLAAGARRTFHIVAHVDVDARTESSATWHVPPRPTRAMPTTPSPSVCWRSMAAGRSR
jgi:hypothetical protein